MKSNVDIQLLPKAVAFLHHLTTKRVKKNTITSKKLHEVIWECEPCTRAKLTEDFFPFWDNIDEKETLGVATHGILKKTQKTPLNEIKKPRK